MTNASGRLRTELKAAGFTDQVLDAAWPEWWSDEAETSPSSCAELRFTLSRRLGVSPKSLLGERVEFVWKDSARFKNLKSESETDKNLLASFSAAVGRMLLAGTTPSEAQLKGVDPLELRKAILETHGYVDLAAILTTCWALGVPVIHLRVFPLHAKRAHATVVRASERYAVILGRDAEYPAYLAFTLAHEIGHIALGHLEGNSVIVDVNELERSGRSDAQEREADEFALRLLTGAEMLDFHPNTDRYSARELAREMLRVGSIYRIEPGTLALCFAYQTKNWAQSVAALRFIYSEAKPVWREVNRFAVKELDWSALSDAEGFMYELLEQSNG